MKVMSSNDIFEAVFEFEEMIDNWSGLEQCLELAKYHNDPTQEINNQILAHKEDLNYVSFQDSIPAGSYDDLFPRFLDHYIKTHILEQQAEVKIPDEYLESKSSTGRYGMMFQPAVTNIPEKRIPVSQSFKSNMNTLGAINELDEKLAAISQRCNKMNNCFILIHPEKSEQWMADLLTRLSADLKKAGITVSDHRCAKGYGVNPTSAIHNAINSASKFIVLATPSLKNAYEDFENLVMEQVIACTDKIRKNLSTNAALPILLEGNIQTSITKELDSIFKQSNVLIGGDTNYKSLLEASLKYCYEDENLNLEQDVTYSSQMK